MFKIAFGLILFLGALAFANDARPQDLIAQAQQHLVRQRYGRADTLCQMVLEKNPDSYRALYLRLSIFQTRMLDYESYGYEGRAFSARADSIGAALTRELPRLGGADSIACLVDLGNAYGGYAVILAKTGNWIAAAKKAMLARSFLKAALRADPNADAAYLGLGLFDYYLASKLTWMPFFKPKQNNGMAELMRALKAPFPFDYAAKNSLCWIYIDKGEYADAYALVRSVLLQMPQNTIFLRIEGKLDLQTGQWPHGITVANKLIELSLNRKPVNWSDCLLGYRILATAYDALHEENLCIGATNKALSFSIPSPECKIPTVTGHRNFIKALQQKHTK